MLDGAMADRTEQPNAEDRTRAAMNRALAGMSDFAQKLIGTDVPPEKIWFRNLLVGLMNCARQNHRCVEIGIAEMRPLASWGARNLLELRVITTYVLGSEANALNFKDDLAADLKEFWEAMKYSGKFVHKKLLAEMRVFATSQSEPLKSHCSIRLARWSRVDRIYRDRRKKSRLTVS